MIVKLNYNLRKYRKGAIIDLDKIPSEEQQYFSRRLKDAKIDNCIEIVNNEIVDEPKKENNTVKKEKQNNDNS